MSDFNCWTIKGNLTKDPDLRMLTDGTPVCHLRVAVNNRRKEKEPLFVDVTTWRRDAQRCAEYLRKGSGIFAVGSLEAELVNLPDGRTILDLGLEARIVEFAGGPRSKGKIEQQPEPAQAE